MIFNVKLKAGLSAWEKIIWSVGTLVAGMAILTFLIKILYNNLAGVIFPGLVESGTIAETIGWWTSLYLTVALMVLKGTFKD